MPTRTCKRFPTDKKQSRPLGGITGETEAYGTQWRAISCKRNVAPFPIVSWRRGKQDTNARITPKAHPKINTDTGQPSNKHDRKRKNHHKNHQGSMRNPNAKPPPPNTNQYKTQREKRRGQNAKIAPQWLPRHRKPTQRRGNKQKPTRWNFSANRKLHRFAEAL